MPPILLPPRLIAFGEEPRGERVNVYHKMKTLCGIFNALDDGERDYLSRQLEVAKPNEIWVLFAGIPIRFSLREFKIVTGLPCGKYPSLKKKKKKGIAGKTIPFYSKLFGLEEDVTVERVITMLKKRIVSDPDMRIRCACLAIIDGFLVPTSHYPKIVKAPAEMVEDEDAFLAYPWGRLSFEMMMKSIKEREIEQLAITCFSVQGLLYALQSVVLQAAPSIQERPVIEETIDSEPEGDEVYIEEAPRESVPFKLGNAKELDKKCSILVDTIICPDLVLDPEEDLSWSDDEEDEKVDNILMFVEEGLIFKNDMFDGGCIPSQMQLPSKKQKRGGKLNGSRTRIAPKLSKNGGVRGKHQRPIPEEGGSPGVVSLESISRLLDSKLDAQGKKIIAAETDWFTKNTVIEGETSKEPVSGSSHRKKPANNGDDGVSNSDDLDSNGGSDDFGFDSLRPSCANARSHNRERTSNVEASVDEILSFYSGKVSTGVGCKEAVRVNVVPMDEDISTAGDVVHNSQGVNNVTAEVISPPKSVAEDNSEHQNNVPMDEDPSSQAGLIADPQGANNVSFVVDTSPQVGKDDSEGATIAGGVEPPLQVGGEDNSEGQVQYSQPTGGVVAPLPNAVEESQGVASSDDGTDGEETSGEIPDISSRPQVVCGLVVDGKISGVPLGCSASDGGFVGDGKAVDIPEGVSMDMTGNKDLDSDCTADSSGEGDEPIKESSKHAVGRGASSVVSSPRQVDSDEDFTTSPPAKVAKAPLLDDGNANNVDGMLGRRSKRLRTLSSKLDGRFQYDKKTKLLVGHPSPVVNQANLCVDLEERFQNSLKKLKAISSISFCGGVALSNKDILDLIDRKKHLSNKVMDALLKFSRHLLRTDDADGEKLRVEVLDTKFVSLFCRQFPKFSRCPSKTDFQFSAPLIDLLSGVGESDRVQLFTEADFMYLPFNFDKKHWVALAVDLNCRKIIVLDSNIQRRRDSAIQDELMPLVVMLPYLFKQAAFNPLMSNCLLNPFSVERPLVIPQVVSPLDSGIFSIFLIHTHATGGVTECVDFEVGGLQSEVKKLVSALILAGGVSNSLSVGGSGIPKQCSCDKFAVIKTSNTVKNPGRLFYCCPNGSEENKNHLFKWTDISMVEEMEEVESMVEKIEGDVGNLAKALHDLASIKESAERCEKEIVYLKGVVSLCEKEIQELRSFKNMIVCGGLVMAGVYYFFFA
ncbi:unnamed protein product [Arabidopsis arenosa]|uniref:Ubiquitin-like protease family profile domain-containing protein n=1 Tax=Arabidopsis arenosa TaxID=38785 RepID=A0A8S1ZYM4_ARAAE|nr:unnamed protein product [Arabidopsis arenosa]